MVTFHIITLFPEVFSAYMRQSVLGKAIEKKKLLVKFYNPRDFTSDNKHKKVDDRVYGGGPGMVLQVEPVAAAVGKALGNKKKAKVLLLAAGGKQFDSKMARRLTQYKDIVLIAGRYEGVDDRVRKIFKADEVTIGPYVLTGGEIPAMVVMDAVARQIKGVLGKDESLEEKRYGVGVPVYTRPEVFRYKGKQYKVPRVLLSGDHKKIEEWRRTHRRSGG